MDVYGKAVEVLETARNVLTSEDCLLYYQN